MLDVQEILTEKHEPLKVDNNQTTTDGLPVSYDEKSYIQVAESEYKDDPLIQALLSNQEIGEEAKISPWLLGEFQGLLELSKAMNKEMGLNFIKDTEDRLYFDQAVRVGDQYSIGGGNLSANFDFPPGYKQIISIHTHILDTIKGTAGFSKLGDEGDWHTIISRSDEKIASIVLCRNGKGYIAIPKQSLEETAKQYAIANSYITPDPRGFLLNNEYMQYEISEGMDDNERVEENVKISKTFNIRLLEVDLKTGQVKKLA